MPARDPTRAFVRRFKTQRSVAEPIASDTLTFKDRTGKKRVARVELGTPQQLPNDRHGDWFCPVFIEGWTPHVIPAMGIGPLDSLMNAVTLVRSFHEHIGSLNIAYGAGGSGRAKRRA